MILWERHKANSCSRSAALDRSDDKDGDVGGFSQVGRRRRPQPVLTYESSTTCRINDMRHTGISRQAFEQTRTQLTSPTCIAISLPVFTNLFAMVRLVPSSNFEALSLMCIVILSAAFTNSFEVGLAMESSTLTNLFAVARVVLSFVFEEPCFVPTVMSSLFLPNSLPVCLQILCFPLFLNTSRSRCK